MTDHPVSERWTAWRQAIDLEEYNARWDALAAAGTEPHGEADLIAALQPASVLDAGCGMGRVAIELDRRGIHVVGADLDDDLLAYARRHAPHITWVHDDLATMQLGERFDVVAMPGNVMIFCRVADRRMVVHTAAQHLRPSGRLVVGFSLERRRDALTLAEYDQLCADCELTLVDRFATWEGDPYTGGDYAVSVHQRTDRFNVHDMVFEARAAIRRVTAAQLATDLSSDDPPLVIDTRTYTDRERFGVIDGSIHAPRTVVEWHLDPANGFRHPQVNRLDQPIVLVCNAGYSSSLAAANLQRLGFTNVADLVGGVFAWRAAGLPLVDADHTHLDL